MQNQSNNDLQIQKFENQSNTISNLLTSMNNDSAVEDFNKARSNIYIMLDTLKDSVEKLAEISEQSQHPRSYEVLAKLIETGVNASKSLLELQTKIRDIQASDMPINDQAKTINNNLFVGSTAELQKMIMEMKNGTRST